MKPLAMQRKKIFTHTLSSQDIAVNWDNPLSNGLVMFMIPGDNMTSLVDISRPWVSPLTTNAATHRKEISSAVVALLPPFESSILEHSSLLFSSIPNVNGYNAFLGGANASGEASMGVSSEVGGGQLATLFGGQAWEESGYVPTSDEKEKLGSSVGMTLGYSTTGRFYVNGRFVGSHGQAPRASSARFAVGSDASLANGTTISNIAAIMVWNRVLSHSEVLSVSNNRFQLLKPRPLKKSFPMFFVGQNTSPTLFINWLD